MEEEKDMTPILIEDLGMLYPTKTSKKRRHYGIFKCQYCGKEFTSMLYGIRIGETKSCGCYNKIKSITHGLSKHRFYDTWKNMMRRCYKEYSESYKNYGGRGIRVCDEWLDDATNFIKWAEETHIEGYSLDRIDNDGNYEPSNCRWASNIVQALNQRMNTRNTSGYVGIHYRERDTVWVSRINVNKNRIYIGSFKTKEEAVKARDDYIIKNKLPHKLSIGY